MTPFPRRSLRWIFTAFLVTAASPIAAMEGTPPFTWLASGPLAPELSAVVSVSPQLGLGSGFSGGVAEDHFQAREYVVCPLLIRYGLFRRLEAYGVFPYFWGSSPQRSTVYLGGTPQNLSGTVAGSDFGDTGLGLRYRVFGDPDAGHEVIAGMGLAVPLGTNVWQWLRYSFQGWLDVPVDLASGDGAWKILMGAQHSWRAEGLNAESFAGYLLKLPLEVTSMGIGFGSSVDVTLPSPCLAVANVEFEPVSDLWLGGRIEGFWAARGKIKPGGYLAQDPSSLAVVLGNYSNLVLATGALWAGVGARWCPADAYGLGVEVMAPVAVHRAYRTWRAGLSISYRWSPE